MEYIITRILFQFLEYGIKLMLKPLRAKNADGVKILIGWLIEVMSNETATGIGYSISEWIETQGGWVRAVLVKDQY